MENADKREDIVASTFSCVVSCCHLVFSNWYEQAETAVREGYICLGIVTYRDSLL